MIPWCIAVAALIVVMIAAAWEDLRP